MLNETYRGMLAHKSVIRETFMYGKQRAAQIGYENVFDYSLGNPSVPCPEQFTAAMQELLAQEDPVALHGYCPSQGDPEFRTAVAVHLNRTFGLIVYSSTLRFQPQLSSVILSARLNSL